MMNKEIPLALYNIPQELINVCMTPVLYCQRLEFFIRKVEKYFPLVCSVLPGLRL